MTRDMGLFKAKMACHIDLALLSKDCCDV